ncbi:MAG: hypothetical protein J2P46_00085 [Zavarzinella sp.]|nr:hypothetical protein [Zavarzinella sp.]
MSSFTSPIVADGPIVAVQFGFAQPTVRTLRTSGRAVLQPESASALMDTGADVSMIGRDLLTPYVREGMPLVGFVHVNAPGLGGLNLRPRYLASLRVEHPTGSARLDFVIPSLDLVEHDFGSLSYEVLIGRDVLARCQFLYDGPANAFTLTY